MCNKAVFAREMEIKKGRGRERKRPGDAHGSNDWDPSIEENTASGAVAVGQVEPERDQHQEEDQNQR